MNNQPLANRNAAASAAASQPQPAALIVVSTMAPVGQPNVGAVQPQPQLLNARAGSPRPQKTQQTAAKNEQTAGSQVKSPRPQLQSSDADLSPRRSQCHSPSARLPSSRPRAQSPTRKPPADPTASASDSEAAANEPSLVPTHQILIFAPNLISSIDLVNIFNAATVCHQLSMLGGQPQLQQQSPGALSPAPGAAIASPALSDESYDVMQDGPVSPAPQPAAKETSERLDMPPSGPIGEAADDAPISDVIDMNQSGLDDAGGLQPEGDEANKSPAGAAAAAADADVGAKEEDVPGTPGRELGQPAEASGGITSSTPEGDAPKAASVDAALPQGKKKAADAKAAKKSGQATPKMSVKFTAAGSDAKAAKDAGAALPKAAKADAKAAKAKSTAKGKVDDKTKGKAAAKGKVAAPKAKASKDDKNPPAKGKGTAATPKDGAKLPNDKGMPGAHSPPAAGNDSNGAQKHIKLTSSSPQARGCLPQFGSLFSRSPK